MDVQRKKGIIEVCVLAVLKKGPSYGYMIIRELEKCLEISESTLYPILKRLEQNGSLKTYRQEYNGRIRKYYELTEEGQHKIDAFLDEWDEMRNLYTFVAEQNAAEPVKEEAVSTEAELPPEEAVAEMEISNAPAEEMTESEVISEQVETAEYGPADEEETES